MNRLYVIAFLIVVCVVQAFFTMKLSNDYSEYKLESQLQVEQAKNRALAAENKFNNTLSGAKDEIQQNFDGQLSRIDAAVKRLDGFRLQDPHRGSQATTNSGSTSGSDDGTQPGILSAEASQFLFGLASDADKERESLIACRKWTDEVQETLQQYAKDLE